MPTHSTRFSVLPVVACVLVVWMLTPSQKLHGQSKNPENKNDQSKTSKTAPGSEYSGMYSFLTDGEFVQITVEEKGHVTGFVSRYGNSESDRGDFLDHFFKSGHLDGNQLAFTTEIVHGVSFEFHGTVERGEGKKPGDEAYYVLKGTLVENTADDANKTSARSRTVALKSFPQDLSPPAN